MKFKAGQKVRLMGTMYVGTVANKEGRDYGNYTVVKFPFSKQSEQGNLISNNFLERVPGT